MYVSFEQRFIGRKIMLPAYGKSAKESNSMYHGRLSVQRPPTNGIPGTMKVKLGKCNCYAC